MQETQELACSRKWQPTPVFLPGKFHDQRRLPSFLLSFSGHTYSISKFPG